MRLVQLKTVSLHYPDNGVEVWFTNGVWVKDKWEKIPHITIHRIPRWKMIYNWLRTKFAKEPLRCGPVTIWMNTVNTA